MADEMEELSSSSKFNWKIVRFSTLKAYEEHGSDVFSVGGFKWQASICLNGEDNVDDYLAMHLYPLDLTKLVHADFSFAVTSQTDPSNTVRYGLITSKLNERRDCICWEYFMRLSELYDPAKGYIVTAKGYIVKDVSISHGVIFDKDQDLLV